MRPLSRREGVWIEPYAYNFALVPSESLALNEQPVTSSPSYYSAPNETLTFTEGSVNIAVAVSLPAIAIDLDEKAPTAAFTFSIPSETLTFTEGETKYSPVVYSVPENDLVFTPQIPSVYAGVTVPHSLLWFTAINPSYTQYDGVYLQDVVYASDVVDYSRDMAFTDTIDFSDALISAVSLVGVLSDSLTNSEQLKAVYETVLAESVLFTETLQGDSNLYTEDVLRVVEVLNSAVSLSGVVADSVNSTDSISSVLGASSTDSLIVSETVANTVLYNGHLFDVSSISESLVSQLQASCTATDSIVISEVLASVDVGVTVDTVNVTEVITSVVGQQQDSTDFVTPSDLLQSAINATQVSADTVLGIDSVTANLLAASTDTVAVSESLSSQILQSGSLVDNVGCSESLTSGLTVYAPVLNDGLIISDVSTTAMQLVGILTDTALAGDTLFEAAQTVYITNAETGAVSTYVFTPTISGMTNYQGILYLAGPDGLYALDATQDEDGVVVWTLRTGFSNLGSDRLKRIQDVNIQARTEGDTTLQIIEDRYGEKQEWNYRLPARTRDSYRDGVTKVGKGINSVYFALGLQGIGPAEIDQLRVVVEPLYRRR